MKVSKTTFLVILAAIVTTNLVAHTPSHSQSARDLVSLDYLFVGAHPDDEGGFTGTMMRYNLDEGFRGSVAVFTLGEGGGNAIGPEVGASLGLIRFEELRRSLSYAGVDRFYFLGLDDFYFTQSAELTHSMWSSQNPDYFCELVRVVRLTRPEVLVTMWPGPGTHGHHQMAARSAIRAFNEAGDPDVCPGLITDEYLEPWQPLKLYIGAGAGQYSMSVPLDEYSRHADMTYADYRALALRSFRSQGWDTGTWNTVPSPRTMPERRQLVRSMVPVSDPETHFLAGTHVSEGVPIGVQLILEAESYHVTPGGQAEISVSLVNESDVPLGNVELSPRVPSGWVFAGSAVSADVLATGQSLDARFVLEAPSSSDAIGRESFWVDFSAIHGEGEVSVTGSNYTWLEVQPAAGARFKPLMDIANYREFAREQGIEWLIPNLATRIPLYIGEDNDVVIEVVNDSDRAVNGDIDFALPAGLTVIGDRSYDVASGNMAEVSVTIRVAESILPANQHSTMTAGSVMMTVEGMEIVDEAELYILPSLSVPERDQPVTVDGDLSDMEGYASGRISHEDLWAGETTGPEDSSADFFLTYDDENLYLGVRVYDDEVVCHMPPDRIRNHWYGDAVEITIDPSGDSSDLSTTFKTSIFPCSTEGPEPNAARYADAEPGPVDRTAPGMEVASRHLDDGYTLQLSIPWSVMPHQPRPGDSIGFNVLIYDADDADAEPGADIGKSRIGWGSVIGAQQATTYLWPRVVLEE